MKKVTISNLFITNFKPKTNFRKTLLNKKKKSIEKKIFSKNFFLFLLLLKLNNNKSRVYKISLFVKKSNQNVITTIRSPYRHKLARHQLWIQRYFIYTTLFFNIKNPPVFYNLKNFLFFFKKIRAISGWMETNLVYQHKSKINYHFFYKNNFLLKNYK